MRARESFKSFTVKLIFLAFFFTTEKGNGFFRPGLDEMDSNTGCDNGDYF